jgi:hypothetical protein
MIGWERSGALKDEESGRFLEKAAQKLFRNRACAIATARAKTTTV